MGADVGFSLRNNIPKITRMLPEEFERALLKSAIQVNNEVKRTLSGQRTGKLYKVPATKRYWRASTPAEPPAVRLSHLKSSYQYKVKGIGFKAQAFVGSPLDYAHYLEYGTVHMRPRRHLSVAFKKMKPKIMKNFEKLIK